MYQFLKKGDKIDVCFGRAMEWRICTVSDVVNSANQNRIVCREPNGLTYSQYGSKLLFAPLHTNTLKLVPLKSPPYHPDIREFYPVYNPKSNKILLKLTGIDDALYEYDIAANDYSSSKHPVLHRTNVYNYISHEFTVNHMLNVVNLETLIRWSNLIHDIGHIDIQRCTLKVFPEAMYQFHIMIAFKHYVFDEQQNKLTEIGFLPMIQPAIVYVKRLNRLIAFRGMTNDFYHVNDMYYFDLEWIDSDVNIHKWVKYEEKLPTISNFALRYVVAFDHILFLYGEGCFFLGTFDLLSLKMKYFVYSGKPLSLPYCCNDCKQSEVVKVNNNVHIFAKDFHYKVCLFDLIPKTLQQYYHESYNPLVFGFVREFETVNALTGSIPICLTAMVLSFFPTFL